MRGRKYILLIYGRFCNKEKQPKKYPKNTQKMKPKKHTILGSILVATSSVLFATSSMIAAIIAVGLVLSLWKLFILSAAEAEKKRYKKISYTIAVGTMGIEIYPVPDGWDVAQFQIEYQVTPIEIQKVRTGTEGNTIVTWEKKGERRREKEKSYKRLNATTLKKGEVKKLLRILSNSDETGIQNCQEVVKAIAKSRKKTKVQRLLKWAASKLFDLKTGHKPLSYPTEVGENTQKAEKQVRVTKKTS